MVEPKIKELAIPKFSINRPVTVVMILFASLIIGVIAYFKIKIDLFPSGMNNPYLGIWVPYSNANPKEIQQQIVKPIEDEIKTVSNLKRIYNNSSSNGCWFWLEFAQNTNMDLAYSQVSDRLERAKPYLPDEIEHLYIRRFRENDEPILYFGITYDSTLKDPNYQIEKYVKGPLEGLKGVANVETWSFREKYFQIIIEEEKLKALKINLSEIMQRLRKDNFSISAGYVYNGSQKLLLRADMKFKTLDDIKNIVIRNGIYLKNIADIRFDYDDEIRNVMRINGKKAGGIAIYKESQANTVETVRLIKKKLKEQFSRYKELEKFKYFIFWDQGSVIEDSIGNVQYTAFWGGLFAFIVLLFFLRRLRITLILTIAIPLTLLFTVIAIYFIGWTLNLITLMGLMISVGMVIDNSIVITENIYRFRKIGYDPRKAAVMGASEVGLAITLATLTTIVVFLPMMLMSGDSEMSFFLVRIGTPVIFALISSLFIALVLIPLGTIKIEKQFLITGNQTIVDKLSGFYKKALQLMLRRRLDFTIALLFVLLSSFVPFSKVNKTDRAEGGPTDARIRVRFPSNYSVEKADSTLLYLASKIAERDSVYNIKYILTRVNGFRGRIELYLKPIEDKQWYQVVYNKIKSILGIKYRRRLTRVELIEDLKKQLPEIPGVRIRYSWSDMGGSNNNYLEYTLQGKDIDKLVEIAEDLESQLTLIPGVLSVDNDMETGKDEIHIIVNREIAQNLGIDPRYIAYYISYTFRGRKISNFITDEREIPIYLKYNKLDETSFHKLKNTLIRTNSGRSVDLASIADMKIAKGMGNIKRENGKSFLQMQVYVNEKDMMRVRMAAGNILKNYNFPEGYSYSEGRRFRRMEEQNQDLAFSLLLSILFVFIIMGVLFESYVLPLSVLISIPTAFAGAFWLLYITNTTFDIMAGIGLVVLVGVVVNNAIVLIDMINQFRNSGLSRSDAIIEAGLHRYRPILMTAFTTIFGLLPMAIGNTSLIGIPYTPMGVTMIGGLLASTILTLFTVPLIYTYLDDLRTFWKNFISRF